ncbi:hypothetical protein GF376_01005 [Candidatus Peregrinibacteria bacterium]|nr:hypothetical protein [Candidatus Peregrinibacteria bacterium]
MLQFIIKNKILILTSILVSILMSAHAPAFAQSASESIRNIGAGSNLPSFDAGHADQSLQPGASNITSAIFFTLDFLQYVLGGVAVLTIIVSGLKLILGGRESGEAFSKEKETIRFAVVGLIIVIVADQVVNLVFWGEEGEIYRSGEDLEDAAERGSEILRGLTGILRVIIPSIAVLFMVIAGFRLVTAGGDTEKVNKAKTQMIWAVAGLILAGLAEIIVFRIVFPDDGSRISDPYEFNRLVVQMTNFLSGFIATIAVTMLIYAGYLYVISVGGENLEKAKKVMIGAIVGLLVSMAAFGLVNTFIKVEPLTDDVAIEDVNVGSP